MKHTLFALAAVLSLSACQITTIVPAPDLAKIQPQTTPPAETITWVLVLIDLNRPTPLMTVEGSYDRMDKCFFKREDLIPGYPAPGTQGICIQVK